MKVEVRFDLNVVSMEAIKKALYRYGDRITFTLSQKEKTVVCVFEPRSGLALPVDTIAITEQLPLDVLDQDLRERLFEQTAHIRNTILALAFSRTGLQG